MNNKSKIALSILTAGILAGCGEDSTINVKESPLPASIGVFVDDPVAGLGYRSESVTNGITNANGEFEYFRGEAITFFIGDIEFPSTAAGSIITPLAVFNTDTAFHPAVVNTLRLLQTLDSDGDPSNGISISSNAANVANMPVDEEGNPISAEEFFAQTEEDFAADVEPWLSDAGSTQTTLVSSDAAIENFVNYIHSQYNSTQSNAFDLSIFTGTIFNPFIDSGEAKLQQMELSPDDDTNSAGSYVTFNGDEQIAAGSYEFLFGNRVLALTTPPTEDTEESTKYIIARSYNTVDSVYSVCYADSSSTLAHMVKTCDLDDSAKGDLLTFSQEQTDIELVNLTELAELESIALLEDFNTDTETFFSSGYKRLSSETGSGALYYKTGGSAATDAENGHLILEGDRFSIGNAATNPGKETSASDTIGSGIYNLSEGFTLSFTVIDHNGSGSLSLYVDNNTTSQSNSVHGAASKFYGKSITAEELPIGERFIYTYVPGEDVVTGADLSHEDARGILNADIKNSFFQLRTDSSARIVIDDLRIETVATEVPDIEPPVEEEPTGEILAIETFETTSEEFFTATYKSLPNDGSSALYNVTSGSSRLTITDGVLSIDNARFSWGNTTPGTETADTDTTTTGVYDLSREYNIVFDVISASEPDATDQDNSFMIYVDNNSSSSGKSIHGGASKFYSAKIADLAQLASGTEVTVPGLLATETSFLQLRAESGAVIEIDNLRIEYLEAAGADAFSCDEEPELYFCDDFSAGNLDNWDIIATPDNTDGAVGFFDILNLEGNNVMRYTAGTAGGELILAKDSALTNVPNNGNYFVEAKIRPRQNSTTANKQLYLMGRYVDTGNWYGGGLNVQNSSSSTQVEVAVSTSGSISRPVQQKSPILLGEKGGETDGVWYSTRFEMIDGDLTVYLNGENMGTASDTDYTARGLIGIFTNNRSFELDDLKVGDPSVKPIQLTLDYKEPTWSTSTTDDALVINVSAFKDDTSADTFTVTSSNEAVVSFTVDGTVLTLTPLAEGNATITLVSGSDESIVRTIEIDVARGFVMPTAEYGDFSDKVTPTVSSIDQYSDTNVSITFDSAITLGSLGEVHIYKESDDSLIDLLKVNQNKGANVDTLSALDKTRTLNYTPLSIAEDGKTLLIDPRNDVLTYGETYYIVIGEDVVTGTQLNGIDFVGLGDNSNWSFTTKFNEPSGDSILVDDDGDADFRTVQGALTYVMNNIDKDDSATISIKDGVYNEMLFLRNQNNITIQGESRENTIVQYDNYETFNGGSSGRPLFLVESADMLMLNNFTLKNSHIRDNAYSNQAEAIYFNSSHRLVANNMNFFSEQDTILVKGYAWFYNSLIAGNVDFIWGYPVAALFEESEIRTLGDSKNGETDTPVSGGYVLQSRTPGETDPGFVFLNGEFTKGPGPLGNTVADGTTYFARSAGKSDAYDNVVLINNKIDSHIATVGWAVQGVNSQPAPNPEVPTAVSGWREYGSMDINGDPLDISARVGGYELSSGEAASYNTRVAVFASYDSGAGWDPQPLITTPTLPTGPSDPAEDTPSDDSNLVLSEDFSATDSDHFFTKEYQALPNDANAPLYNVTSGGSRISITDGEITIDNARFSIGETDPDTDTADTDTVGAGIFDLTNTYKISFDLIAASEPDSGDQGNSFFIYVDNNTSSGDKSVHGGSSKFYTASIVDLATQVGNTITIEGLTLGTATSFFQLRCESGAVVTIDNLRIEYDVD